MRIEGIVSIVDERTSTQSALIQFILTATLISDTRSNVADTVHRDTSGTTITSINFFTCISILTAVARGISVSSTVHRAGGHWVIC